MMPRVERSEVEALQGIRVAVRNVAKQYAWPTEVVAELDSIDDALAGLLGALEYLAAWSTSPHGPSETDFDEGYSAGRAHAAHIASAALAAASPKAN